MTTFQNILNKKNNIKIVFCLEKVLFICCRERTREKREKKERKEETNKQTNKQETYKHTNIQTYKKEERNKNKIIFDVFFRERL
jgi:hypothetical protein